MCMKKFYLTTGLLFTVLLFSQSLFAQAACPGPNPPVVKNYTYFINGQQVCAVYVENMIPNSPVTLFGPGLVVIPTASGTSVTTDATGFACYIFPCNQTPVRVTTCNVQGCCSALVPAAAILPVRLTKFVGRLAGDNSVSLDWATAAELNSNKYEIERSLDGKTFEKIGEMGAAGNSASTRSYQFNDKLPTAGAYFYRLKQIDIDEKFEYSRVVYVNSGKAKGSVTSVFPNPFQSDIQLVGISTADLNAKNVRLFNMAGQQVRYRIAGANAIAIDDNSPKGIYILKVNDQTFKLIKN